MYTHYIRTVHIEDDPDRLTDEFDQIKWDVIGLCETCRKWEGLSEIKGGCWVYEIGITEDNHDTKGLAFQYIKKIKIASLILKHDQTVEQLYDDIESNG